MQNSNAPGQLFMTPDVFLELVNYSDYPSFVVLFPNIRHTPKFNYLSQYFKGQRAG